MGPTDCYFAVSLSSLKEGSGDASERRAQKKARKKEKALKRKKGKDPESVGTITLSINLILSTKSMGSSIPVILCLEFKQYTNIMLAMCLDGANRG